MEEWVTHFEAFFQQYGYFAVFVLLLLENAGIPVPGETTLLYASFLAFKGEGLRLQGIIPTAILAAVTGDSIGFWLGRKGGPRVARLLRLTPERLAYVQRFFEQYGSWTVFFARFIAGLRIICGPAAGLSGMPWARFFVFNASGAVVWVCTIASVGYFFGASWEALLSFVKRLNITAAVLAVLIVAVVWWWRKRR